jgi:MFS family permease
MSAPGFRRVLAAESVSNFGSMLSRLALPWLAAIALDASPMQMAALVIADVVAGTIGAVVLGTFIDRASRRATMVAMDIARTLLVGALAALAWAGALAMWMLVAAAVVAGLLTMAFEMARSAWIGQHIEAAALPRRNAQLSAAASVAETLAFAIGGWLYQAFGAIVALVVDAGSYLVSALCLRGVAAEERPSAPQARAGPAGSALRRFGDDTARGLRAIAASPRLGALALADGLVALGFGMAGTSYMIFVTRDLGLPTGPLGLVFAAGGLGSLLGAALAPRLGRTFGPGPSIAIGVALLGLGAACIPLAPGATAAGVALLVAHQVVGDGGHVIQDVHGRTLKQTLAQGDLLARVDGALRTVAQLGALIGAIAGGALASSLGARGVLAFSAAIYGVAAGWAALTLRARSPAIAAT